MEENETAANPADEATSIEVSQTEATTPVEGDEDLIKLGLGDETEAPEPKIIEVEIDGKMVKVSEDAKDYLLRQADYTRKTTEVAEQRKAIEAEKAQVGELRMYQEAVINSRAQLTALDMQIQTLAATQIDGLPQEQINAMQAHLLNLQAQRQEVAGDAHKIAEAEQAKLSDLYGKQRQEAIAEASRSIPNFNDTRRAELEKLAVDLGVPKEDAETISDKAAYEILHLADIGRKFLQRQRAAKSVETAQSASPVPQVGGKSQAARDPSKMTTEEWMKHRNSQVRA